MVEWNAMENPKDLDWELMAKRMEEGLVAFGTALIGYLYKGCLDRGVELILNTRAMELSWIKVK